MLQKPWRFLLNRHAWSRKTSLVFRSLVDIAAMRSAVAELGGDAGMMEPLVPVDLVIDHSIQVDAYGSENAFQFNTEREFERNKERYEFLKWGQQAFEKFNIIPPSIGIVHQVNLEYLAKVVMTEDSLAYPDTVVGTDSHTTMINGLGIVGWGVGGIEAEAAMLGQPVYILTPEVLGVHLKGELREGVTATDLVLTVTQRLRAAAVVDKFVEFFGEGVDALSLPDRATLSNMCPEYGATIGFFPPDAETMQYLRLTGRDETHVDMVEAYLKAQAFSVSHASVTLNTPMCLKSTSRTLSRVSRVRNVPKIGSLCRMSKIRLQNSSHAL